MIQFLLQATWADRVGWVLIHSLWQFALAALVALAMQLALRRRAAATRYGVLLAVMVMVVSLPALTWLLLGQAGPPNAGPAEVAGSGKSSPQLFGEDAMRPSRLPRNSPLADLDDLEPAAEQTAVSQQPAEAASPGGPLAWWSQWNRHIRPWLPRIVLFWIAGVAVFALRPLLSWYTVRRLRTARVSPVPAAVHELLERTARKLGLGRAVEVLQSAVAKTPVVIGYFRPLVLLPLCVVSGLPESQLELILAHELAHIRRHDYLVNLLQTLIETLFFYHPAVWWLSRQIRNERENCCDDMALALAASRAEYGRALLAIEELRAASPSLSLAAGGGSLLARIRRISGCEPTPKIVGGGSILGVILVSLAIAVAATWDAIPAAEKLAADDSSVKQVTAAAESPSDAPLESSASAGNVIEGIVVDEQGKPMAGATVWARELEGEDSRTTSNADGTFRLPVRTPFAPNTALTAGNADKTRQAILNLRLQNKPCRLVLKPSHAIDVTVVDAGARPAAGAPVIALAWNGQVARGATNAQGKARLDIPADARNVCIMAYKPGVGLDYFEADGEDGNFTARPDDPRYSPPDAARLVLDGTAPVEVRTVDAAGKPVSGLNVKLADLWKTSKQRLMAWDAKLAVKSDAQGRATFAWLPAKLDRISFSVSADDGDYVERESVEFRVTDGGDPRHLTARVVRAATFSGRVTFPDGNPAAGILLEAEGRPGKQTKTVYDRGWARTANDGSYRFKVTPNQDYTIAVCDDHWAGISHLGLIAHEGEKWEHLDFQLQRGTLIHGRVTVGREHLPGNGKSLFYPTANLVQLGPPIPDAWKWPDLTRHGPEQYRTRLVRWSDIDDNGRYSARVAPGEYYLQLPSERHNVIVSGQAEIVIDDHLPEQLPRSLHGQVVDKAGRPVANAVVAFPSNLHLRTDKDGRFSTFGDLAPCRIHARSAEANLAGSQTIAKGDSTVTIEMLPAATATGRVLDVAGRPLAGVRIHYFFSLRAPAELWRFFVDVETGKEGKYAMAGLPVGFQGDEVTLSWYNPANQAYEVVEGPKFTVKPGENRLPDTIVRPSTLKAGGPSGKTSALGERSKPADPITTSAPIPPELQKPTVGKNFVVVPLSNMTELQRNLSWSFPETRLYVVINGRVIVNDKDTQLDSSAVDYHGLLTTLYKYSSAGVRGRTRIDIVGIPDHPEDAEAWSATAGSENKVENRPWRASQALMDLLTSQAKAIGPAEVGLQVDRDAKFVRPWETVAAELAAPPTDEQIRGEAGVSDGLMAVHRVTTSLSRCLVSPPVDCVIRNVKPLSDLTPQEMHGLLERAKPLVAPLGFTKPPRAAFIVAYGNSWSKLRRADRELGLDGNNHWQALSKAMGVNLQHQGMWEAGRPAARTALRVHVLGSDGRPVSSATVTMAFPPETQGLFKYDVSTFQQQKDGSWLSGILPDDEEFTLTASAPGYEPQSQKLKAPLGQTKELDVQLKPSAAKNDPAGKTSAAKPAGGASPDTDEPSEAPRSREQEPPPGFLILPAYVELAGRERRQRYGIDAAQEKELRNIADEFDAARRKISEVAKESQKLSPEERKAKLKQLQTEYVQAEHEGRKRIESLLTARQRADYLRDDRYNSALWFCNDPRSASRAVGIELSQKQREQFDRLADKGREEYPGNSARTKDRLLAVLAPQQREKLLARFNDTDLALTIVVPPLDAGGVHALATKLAPPPLYFSFVSHRMSHVIVYGSLHDPAVRKELAVTADQEERLQAVLVKSETAAQKTFDRYEPKTVVPKPSHEVQESQRAEYRRALEQFGRQVIAEIEAVLQPRQVAQLKAIARKNRAAESLWYHYRATLDDLHVTAEQRAKLWDIYSQNAEPDVASFRARGEKALGILTPQQRQKLEDHVARIP
jgi:beta-lactamase regulating signal transducer with metallopeptidase domain/protocatechuate 3,4-dioxygenase beta subunit